MFLPRPVRLRARDDVVDALVEVREELGEGPRGHLPGLGLDIDAEVLRGALPLRLAFHLACSASLSRKGNEIQIFVCTNRQMSSSRARRTVLFKTCFIDTH